MPRVIHFEFHVSDPDKTVQFFSDVFGWKFQKWEGPMDYWLITTGDPSAPGIDGGMVRKQGNENVVNNVMDVDDVDAYTKKVQDGGGTIVVPKMAVPGVGWLVYFKDFDGNIWGMMQNDPNAA